MSRSRNETKKPASPLARLFANPAVLDVLSKLLLNSGKEFYQSELADLTGSTLLQVQRALVRIEAAGLLEKSKRGNRVYYTVNRRHPVCDDLKRVALKTVGLGDALREALSQFRDRIDLAFIYGSFASGTESPASDVDVVLIGRLTSRQAATALGEVGRELSREFNPVLYPAEEFRRKARRGNRFIKGLLTGPKLWLIGGADDLAQLVE